MQYKIKLAKTEKEMKDFVDFPSTLYNKRNLTQNKNQEKELLIGEHILSKYFSFFPLLIYRNNNVVARGALTLYPDIATAYFGFFEAQNNQSAVNSLFKFAEKIAKKENYSSIIGPVDASFWIGYRLKTNRFSDPPYFGEPYHLPYYQQLWRSAEFHQKERYLSNIFPKNKIVGYQNTKFQKRLSDFKKSGYKILSPRYENWDNAIHEVYSLIISLYSDFPVFSYIDESDFIKHYSGLKEVLDFSMTKIAYCNNKPVAFLLAIPNYGALLNKKLSIITMLKVLKKRKGCKDYIMLYLGVDPEHLGLGSAIGQIMVERLSELNASAIGAFFQENKITGRYAKDIVKEQYEYLLFEKPIE